MAPSGVSSDITSRTKVEIGLLVALSSGVIAMATGVVLFDRRLTAIEQTLQGSIGDEWTLTLQSEYQLRLQLANPSMAIPDPRDPSRLLRDVMRGGN